MEDQRRRLLFSIDSNALKPWIRSKRAEVAERLG